MTLDAARRVGLPMACPFLAFADERDFRAGEPDHRHRCYAEAQPAPRALAHQARYCLSPGFASCPIFQDWAVRETAQVSEPADVPGAAPGLEAGFFDEAAGTGAERAERMPEGAERMAERPERAPERVLEPEVIVTDEFGEDAWTASADGEAGPALREWDRPRRREAYPTLRRTGGATQPLVLGLVGLAVVAGLLFLLPSLLSAFFGGGEEASPTPTLTDIASPTALTSPTPPGETLPPEETTPPPGPTPLVYVVQRGDTLSAIAQRFDVTLQEILDANPEITDPGVIKVGQGIIIPTSAPAPTETL